ncbi:hypothetical protein [Rhodanobacter ginsengiterrae]|uniref:hypothetical protein n=1 Tax=Rhodanobacter ginsengiterrae TaxID=2008451 RepID=UPI003CE82743
MESPAVVAAVDRLCRHRQPLYKKPRHPALAAPDEYVCKLWLLHCVLAYHAGRLPASGVFLFMTITIRLPLPLTRPC